MACFAIKGLEEDVRGSKRKHQLLNMKKGTPNRERINAERDSMKEELVARLCSLLRHDISGLMQGEGVSGRSIDWRDGQCFLP